MSSSRRRPERRLSIAQGRDAREIQLPPSAGKCFLLTSPFIERVRHIILRSPGAAAPPEGCRASPAFGLAAFQAGQESGKAARFEERILRYPTRDRPHESLCSWPCFLCRCDRRCPYAARTNSVLPA